MAQEEGLGIASVVNNSMISNLDVNQRIALALVTTGMADTPQIREQMRPQMLRGLIDEMLQLQEAKRLGVMVTEAEIMQGFERLNQQRQMPSGTFERFIQERGVPLSAAKSQIRAQIAWSKVVGQKLRSKVRISEDEVSRERESLAAGQDITEYNISSIVLSVNKPEEDESVRGVAEKLVTELKAGADFTSLAHQFSAGGEMMVEQNQRRWVQLHQLEPMLAKAIGKLQQPGDISSVVRTLAGYHIIKLNDTRKTNTAQVFDSEMLLKQISMKLKPDAAQKEAEVLLDIAREVAKRPGTCSETEVAGVSELDDLEFDVAFQRANFKQLQPQVQGMVANLRVGDVSEPFATPEGIHLIMLCERIELPPELPPEQVVREKLFQEKLELESTKRLRELRREAFIETR